MYSTREFFDIWAGFYDEIYAGREIGDIEFYIQLARQADDPILEIGCGTGRIYLELVREGVDAYGIDISEDMLAMLKRKAANSGLTANVRQADMREFTPRREYSLIIVPFRTFLYNTKLADQKAALRNFHSALRRGGKLALNFYVPRFEVICERYGQPEKRTFTQNGCEYIMRRVTSVDNEVKQVIKIEQSLKQADETLREETIRLALISKAEFELLLEMTGWSDWIGYGGFDREPLEDGAREMVWIAEK